MIIISKEAEGPKREMRVCDHFSESKIFHQFLYFNKFKFLLH